MLGGTGTELLSEEARGQAGLLSDEAEAAGDGVPGATAPAGDFEGGKVFDAVEAEDSGDGGRR